MRDSSAFFFFLHIKIPLFYALGLLGSPFEWKFLYYKNKCVFFFRDHYVEGRMRGVAPNKKIAAVQQKNVDVWVWLKKIYLFPPPSGIFLIINHSDAIAFSKIIVFILRKTKKNKQKSKFNVLLYCLWIKNDQVCKLQLYTKAVRFSYYYWLNYFYPAPGAGEGTSTGELPHPPRKKRARVDPTVESVSSLVFCLLGHK